MILVIIFTLVVLGFQLRDCLSSCTAMCYSCAQTQQEARQFRTFLVSRNQARTVKMYPVVQKEHKMQLQQLTFMHCSLTKVAVNGGIGVYTHNSIMATRELSKCAVKQAKRFTTECDKQYLLYTSVIHYIGHLIQWFCFRDFTIFQYFISLRHLVCHQW